MFALMDLWQLDNNVFEVKDMVLKGERAIEGSGTFDSVRSCNMMAGGNWAVHFRYENQRRFIISFVFSLFIISIFCQFTIFCCCKFNSMFQS